MQMGSLMARTVQELEYLFFCVPPIVRLCVCEGGGVILSVGGFHIFLAVSGCAVNIIVLTASKYTHDSNAMGAR